MTTKSQRAALKWLRDRGGTGLFGKRGVLLAAGEWAPFTRGTWNALREQEFVVFEGRRVTVNEAGLALDCGYTVEREPIEHLGVSGE